MIATIAFGSTLALFVTIWRSTAAFKPWKKKFTSPEFDLSASFATNLGALTMAINALMALAAGSLSAGEKTSYLLMASVFALITGMAPLLCAIWRAPAPIGSTTPLIYFSGVVAAILAAATGAVGQLEVLVAMFGLKSVKTGNLANAEWPRVVLWLAALAVIVYGSRTAYLLARPVEQREEQATAPTPQPWKLP